MNRTYPLLISTECSLNKDQIQHLSAANRHQTNEELHCRRQSLEVVGHLASLARHLSIFTFVANFWQQLTVISFAQNYVGRTSKNHMGPSWISIF